MTRLRRWIRDVLAGLEAGVAAAAEQARFRAVTGMSPDHALDVINELAEENANLRRQLWECRRCER